MIEQVQSNLDKICEIGMENFHDDLETLQLIMYSYKYVYNQLTKYDYEKINLDIYQNLIKQEKILTERMKTSLKTIETDCLVQIWMYEDYGDPLLLGNLKNTTLIRTRIRTYLCRCKKYKYSGYKTMKWISRLLISIQAMGVEEIKIRDLLED